MDWTAVIVIPTIFIGLPWLIFHYVTKWKTAPTLTRDDEALLEELFQLARRLEARMETVERLVAADHPEFRPAQLAAPHPEDDRDISDRLRAQRAQHDFRQERTRP